MDTSTTTATAASADSDDDVLAQLEARAQKKTAELAAAQKAANVAVGRKFLELSASGEDLFVIGDAGGTFRGIFRAPSPELHKRWKSDMRTDQGRLIGNQNLVTSCMVWPTADVLQAAVLKRAALYDVLGIALQERAGQGQEAYSKG